MNPLFILSKSALAVIFLKFVVVGIISWELWTYVPKKRFLWSYVLVFAIVFLSLAQFLGFFSNVFTYDEVVSSEPGSVVPLEAGEAMSTYVLFSFLLYYVPLLLSLLSFWIWESIYLKGGGVKFGEGE